MFHAIPNEPLASVENSTLDEVIYPMLVIPLVMSIKQVLAFILEIML
jgi:hypothetical protein